MKIIQIVTQCEAGGAQAVAAHLNKALQDRGHNAELWFLYRKRVAFDGIPGVRCLFPSPPRWWEYPVITWRLLKALARHRPQAVVTHTHYANILGQAAARVVGGCCRIAVHHSPLETYPAAAKILDRLGPMLGFYTRMVAVSGSVVESARRHPGRYRALLTLIYNGIPQRTPLEAPVDARASIGLAAKTPILLNVGRLSLPKNQELLLDVLPHLPDVHLVIAGEGELRDRILSRAAEVCVSDRVHLLGEVPNHIVTALMKSADIFVFPSKYEAMPMALLEAMAAGAAIVASDIPANRELLGDSGLIRRAEPDEFAEAIAALLDATGERARLGAAAAERANKFTIEEMVQGYERLLTNQ